MEQLISGTGKDSAVDEVNETKPESFPISMLIIFSKDATGTPVLENLNLPNISSQHASSQMAAAENIIAPQQKPAAKKKQKEKAKASKTSKSNLVEKFQALKLPRVKARVKLDDIQKLENFAELPTPFKSSKKMSSSEVKPDIKSKIEN